MTELSVPHFTTPENLIIRESTLEDGSVIVEEVGHFDFVIYRYKELPLDHRSPQEALLKLIKDKGLEELFRLLEELPSIDKAEGIAEAETEGSKEGTYYEIYHEETGPAFLAERIKELERRCDDLLRRNPVSIDLARWRSNRKAAKRRLRRLIRESFSPAVIAPEEYHKLIRKTLDEAPDNPPIFDKEWCDEMLYQEGEIDEFREYWRRRSERVFIVVERLPREMSFLISEASEAYYRGLFRATAALCRSMLEDILRRAAKARALEGGPIPIADDSLDVLINCIPSSLLGREEKQHAHYIRIKGNAAMHEPRSAFSEKESWQLLSDTFGLIEKVINRGGLGQSQGA